MYFVFCFISLQDSIFSNTDCISQLSLPVCKKNCFIALSFSESIFSRQNSVSLNNFSDIKEYLNCRNLLFSDITDISVLKTKHTEIENIWRAEVRNINKLKKKINAMPGNILYLENKAYFEICEKYDKKIETVVKLVNPTNSNNETINGRTYKYVLKI